jgi:hypothetical protein
MDTNETGLIINVLSLVLRAVNLIPRERRNRTVEEEDALTALSDAYHATLQYYEFLKAHPRDATQEIGIAHKWARVGILLKKYDPTLAERLDAKSRYWREGATWSDKIIHEAGIGLEDIRREVNLRVKYV